MLSYFAPPWGFYLRFVPAPFVPALEQNGELVRYEDWHTHFMQTRERASYSVAWPLKLAHQGAARVNGSHAASVMQYKPFQFHALATRWVPAWPSRRPSCTSTSGR